MRTISPLSMLRAAEVLTNLKVMQGYDDGSFLPQRNITRAQVATLIYRAATGDVTDSPD